MRSKKAFYLSGMCVSYSITVVWQIFNYTISCIFRFRHH